VSAPHKPHNLLGGSGHLSLTGQPVQLLVLGDLVLDPKGRLYEFMLTFLVASAGLTPTYDSVNYSKFMQGVEGVFPGTVGAKVDLAKCIQQVRAGALPQQQAETSLCSMLANISYESLTDKDKAVLKNNPVFEVFRHVRNAASHGNRWHFIPKEPRSPGQWNHVVIDPTRKGNKNPLHGKQCFYGTLKPADLLYLLRDVEKLLP
jgi:hypothetical protein